MDKCRFCGQLCEVGSCEKCEPTKAQPKKYRYYFNGLLSEIWKDEFDRKNFGSWRLKTPKGYVFFFRTKKQAEDAMHQYVENGSFDFKR